MKHKLFFTLALFFAAYTFAVSQTDEVSKEKMAALGNVSKGNQLSGSIPVVNWPIAFESENGMNTFSFPLMSAKTDFSTRNFQGQRNNTATIHQLNGILMLTISADFVPVSEREIAAFFFSMGIDQVMLQGKLISILDYIEEFKILATEKTRINRIYVTQ